LSLMDSVARTRLSKEHQEAARSREDRLFEDEHIKHDGLRAESAEEKGWACRSCTVREAGVCGALLGGGDPNSPPQRTAIAQDFHKSHPRRNIYDAGANSDDVIIICSGWAFRFVHLPDGRRQTLSILLPGDIVSATSIFAGKMNYSVQALTKLSYCKYRRAEFENLLVTKPAVLRSFAAISSAEQERAEEAIVDLGRRTASERISRFIMNLMERLAARGMVRDAEFDFPLRQQHIADAVGLTTVHVSRIIGAFRQAGLIDISGGRLKINRLTEFRTIADCK
jgi:CRP/FNR family transcriptional regulator, anaerobic regulatory protein